MRRGEVFQSIARGAGPAAAPALLNSSTALVSVFLACRRLEAADFCVSESECPGRPPAASGEAAGGWDGEFLLALRLSFFSFFFSLRLSASLVFSARFSSALNSACGLRRLLSFGVDVSGIPLADKKASGTKRSNVRGQSYKRRYNGHSRLTSHLNQMLQKKREREREREKKTRERERHSHKAVWQ